MNEKPYVLVVYNFISTDYEHCTSCKAIYGIIKSISSGMMLMWS